MDARESRNETEEGLDGVITRHARSRMVTRGLSLDAIEAALDYGREVRVRGAVVFAIGKKEIRRFKRHGIDLCCFEGVQVVCSRGGTIMTVYRNRNFRGLKPRRRQRISA